MPKITEVFAFVVTDQDEDDEGIMGMQTPMGWMPFVGGDMARVASLREAADTICAQLGKPYRILRFSVREDIT